MTDTVQTQRPLSRNDLVQVVAGLVVIAIVSIALNQLSLSNVSGATRRPNGGCCNTEFVNGGWWLALAVVAFPVWWVTRLSPWAGIVAVLIPTYVTFHIAATTIHRYQDSGWGDGLEVLSYILSVVHLVLFLAAAGVGVWSGRRLRRRRELEGAPTPDVRL